MLHLNVTLIKACIERQATDPHKFDRTFGIIQPVISNIMHMIRGSSQTYSISRCYIDSLKNPTEGHSQYKSLSAIEIIIKPLSNRNLAARFKLQNTIRSALLSN